MNPKWLDYSTWKTPRWKTAIKRNLLSSPVRLAVEQGLINKGDRVLDFGCGRGDDVERLTGMGVEAVGFDPYYNNIKYDPTNIVSCCFVINVIEEEDERVEVLKFVWELAITHLIVSVRTDNKTSGITSIGTYQKYYTQTEFLAWVKSVLPDTELSSPKSGVVFLRKTSKVVVTAGHLTKKRIVEDAIACIQSLKSDYPDPSTLIKFPGAGVLKEAGVFTSDKPAWVVEARNTIQQLLTAEEWEELVNVGMLNQHFTSHAIAQEMWDFAFEFTGYRKLKVLDPGCGTGRFYHTCPHPNLITYIGVEITKVAADIAKCSTGSNAAIWQRDFLKWEYPEQFDLAIGNVPFVNGCKKVVLDERRVNLGLHAQFFIKSLGHLAPGGLLIFLTTTSTLDAVGEDYVKFREWVRDRANFLGAIRLPHDGSAYMGGTEVTTDLVILQKK